MTIFTHALINPDSSVDRLASAVDPSVVRPGQQYIQLSAPQTGWPPKPFGSAVLSCSVYGVLSWSDPRALVAAQAEKIAELRARREAFEQGGFTWDGSRFDSDDKAQMRIMGLAQAAQDPAFTPKDWRLADNTWRTLDAADAAGVWAALQAHIELAFSTFAALEAQVLAATTNAAVQAIAWEDPQ